jgi:hypothetical protein
VWLGVSGDEQAVERATQILRSLDVEPGFEL